MDKHFKTETPKVINKHCETKGVTASFTFFSSTIKKSLGKKSYYPLQLSVVFIPTMRQKKW